MRYFIRLCYDGYPYCGYQKQQNHPSVQETLEHALSTLLRKTIEIVGCGRTDTGVHAEDFYAHFDSEEPIDGELLKKKLNGFLDDSIAIKEIFRVADTAHARFDAISRTYRYRFIFYKSPFLIRYRSYLHKPLDWSLLETATQLLTKYEDFTTFTKQGSDNTHCLCKVTEALWKTDYETYADFYITSNRFLRNMVRAIVGSLIQVGEGKMSVQEFEDLLIRPRIHPTGFTAAAKALFLHKITYPENIYAEALV